MQSLQNTYSKACFYQFYLKWSLNLTAVLLRSKWTKKYLTKTALLHKDPILQNNSLKNNHKQGFILKSMANNSTSYPKNRFYQFIHYSNFDSCHNFLFIQQLNRQQFFSRACYPNLLWLILYISPILTLLMVLWFSII